VKEEDGIDLPDGDFRRLRRYLAPWLFADGDDATTYPPPSDLVEEESWDHVMVLATDVVLKTSSYEGSTFARLSQLETDWISSWPNVGQAPYMEEAAYLAGEEFSALVVNAVHGFYRQAIGCLRNALEVMTVAAGFAVTNNWALFQQWRQSGQEIGFGQARAWLRDSGDGQQVDGDAAPESVFGNSASSWTKSRYARLCAYAHSRSGYNNVDFWESNGPVFRPQALSVVEAEFRETLAVSYLLLKLGWPTYSKGQGVVSLMAGPMTGWIQYLPLLGKWVL
jgi:hypothetical protein